jgi:hypothetical protein
LPGPILAPPIVWRVDLFTGLIDDAAMFPPGNAGAADAVAAHKSYRGSWFAPLIGPLVVSDTKLGEVDRAVRGTGEPDPLAVSMINSGGAGGLVSLAGRKVPGLRVVAVESALRDLDDLAGNAARVVAAAEGLGESVRVFVEIPYAPGWERAVTEVEAAGRYGKIRTGGPEGTDTPSVDQLARQLSVLVEADLPFKATAGLHHAWASDGTDPGRPRQHGFLNLILAVESLIEGASESDAADLLGQGGSPALVERIAGWTDAHATRIRRRFRSFGCCGVLDPVQDLVSLGLVKEPA